MPAQMHLFTPSATAPCAECARLVALWRKHLADDGAQIVPGDGWWCCLCNEFYEW